jgi:predicted unusual protein kinase regulating ubiquinone biosynthesis (AarF/ABC1/UbiB family)
MSSDKVPVSKIARASKFLKTGMKVGGEYAKHYGKTMLTGKAVDQEALERDIANDLFESFSELRGSALKVAQMLSMDNVNFGSAFGSVMQKAQYSVPPMSAPLAVKTFTKSVGKAPEDVFDFFNPKAVRAASMGQVHEAMKDGVKLAVKIQYPGVADSIKSDLALVKGVAGRVMGVSQAELGPYLKEVESKLVEESNYRLELQNSIEFAEACKELTGVVFPKYFPEYSSDRVITMEWIEGRHMKEFLATNPGEELRLTAAQNLWEYYELQVHKLRKLNSDPHPGNFLFRKDGTIGVLDFGCTKELSNEVYDGYYKMADPTLFDDYAKAEQVLLQLELLRPADDAARRKYLVDLFGRMIQLIAKPYHLGRFYFNDNHFYEQITELGTEIAKLHELRGSKDYLFINRTYFGLFSLFQQLDVEMNTVCQFRDDFLVTDPALRERLLKTPGGRSKAEVVANIQKAQEFLPAPTMGAANPSKKSRSKKKEPAAEVVEA